MGKVTKNLSPHEIVCKCGCGFSNAQLEAIDMVQLFANRTGSRIQINRFCTCPEHHMAQYPDGEANWDSMHLLGIACDLEVIDCNHDYACHIATEMYNDNMIGGLILYENFIHMDKRRVKYFKDKRGE